MSPINGITSDLFELEEKRTDENPVNTTEIKFNVWPGYDCIKTCLWELNSFDFN